MTDGQQQVLVATPLQRLDILEQRRRSIAAAMWQVPTLTVAGQAFLLQVLVSKDTSRATAALAAAAGVLATGAAWFALIYLVAVERRHYRSVEELASENRLLDTEDVDVLGDKGSALIGVTGAVMWVVFLAALIALVAADIAAYFGR